MKTPSRAPSLLFRVAVSVLLVAGCGGLQPAIAPSPGESEEQTAKVSGLLQSGRFDEALSEAEVLRQLDPTAPRADFFAACAYLELGRFEAATEAAQRAAEAAPKLPEVQVLRALVSRRRAHPEEQWATSLGNAWREAGRPDLRKSGILESPDPLDGDLPVLPSPPAHLRPLAGLIMKPSLSRDERALLREALPEVASAELVWLALNRLWRPDQVKPESREALLAQARRFPRHREIQLAASSVMLHEGPFTEEEIQTLEHLAGDSFDDRKHREAVDWLYSQAEATTQSGPVDLAVYMVALDLALPVNLIRLRERIEASSGLTPELKHRLAEAVRRLAEHWYRYPTVLERMVAVTAMESAAKLAGEAPPDLVRTTREAYRLASSQVNQTGSWPLPSLKREWVLMTFVDELAYLTSRAGLSDQRSAP